MSRALSRLSAAAVGAVALATVAGTAGAALASPPSNPIHAGNGPAATQPRAAYIVVMRAAPVASYAGTTPGFTRTEPQPGQRFDDDRPAVAAYRTKLFKGQSRLLAKLGHPAVLYRYSTALDGFAAELTADQVKTLRSSPGVLLVQRDRVLPLEQSSRSSTGAALATHLSATPSPSAQGLWREVGGAAHAGRGVVVGVVDSGVWPENPAVAGIPMRPETLRARYPGFTGECEPGDRWPVSTCGSKVLAARYFVRGFGRGNVASSDFLSARDGDGHGTGVAALAAGNPGVDARLGSQDLGRISGAAPSAGISVYKACWTAPDPARDGCDSADALAAVDRAVRDGVDVLTYSIGGGRRLDDAVELAFLNAAAANVFVVAAAGNSGPAAGTVQHPSPWATTVGANTQSVLQGGVELGDGETLIGAMLSDRRVGPTRLVDAADAVAASTTTRRAALCYPGALDAQKVDGAIVVCRRGVTSRVSKGAAVAQAGGAGMVLVNPSPQDVDADVQRVPTVHLNAAAGHTLTAYLDSAGPGATATLLPAATNDPPVPSLGRFSGRGPSPAAAGNLLKPDLTAPGVGVITASAPTPGAEALWNVSSGTSAAAPTVAGVAADLIAAHPHWTPGDVKSAIMTTAGSLVDDSDALESGAGELDPAAALEPGLVYHNGVRGWVGVLQSLGVRIPGYAKTAPVAPSALNLPSVAIGALVGETQVVRRVTNVSGHPATFTARLSGLPGIAAAVTPRRLTLKPGQTAAYTLHLTATRDATYAAYSTGELTWTSVSGQIHATIPVAVRPQAVSAPAAAQGYGSSGMLTLTAKAGVTGTIATSTTGLVGASPVQLSLAPGSFDPSRPVTSQSTAAESLRIPAGSPAARFQVLSGWPRDDVDLYVYRGTTLVASSTGPTGDESVVLQHPAPGAYRVFITAHSAAHDAPTVDCAFASWVLPSSPQDTLTLSDRAIVVIGGQRFPVQVSWSHLDTHLRWWGQVTYSGAPHPTSITIN